MEAQTGFRWPITVTNSPQAPHRRSRVRGVDCAVSSSASGSAHLSARTERGVLRLVGDVDLATCQTLVEALDAVIDQAGGDIILDCAGVTFFGAIGVDALAGARNRLDGSGRRLVVRNPSSIVRRLLDIVDMGDLFADASDAEVQPTSGD